jgi:hypothetical protein
MEHGQKNQIEEVNTYENEYEVEIKSELELEPTIYKNCVICEYLRFDSQCKMFCYRRKNEGVICEIDKDKAHLSCHARDAEVWDEEINEDGEFKADNELGYGYQKWLKKMEERDIDNEI